MSEPGADLSFRELVFSDMARYRADANPSWLKVLARCLTVPGMIASLIVRADIPEEVGREAGGERALQRGAIEVGLGWGSGPRKGEQDPDELEDGHVEPGAWGRGRRTASFARL